MLRQASPRPLAARPDPDLGGSIERRMRAETPDPAVLHPWFEEHVVGFRGPLTVERLQGGQSNPTFRLAAPGAAYVLRRKPFGQLLPSAHAVEREYRVMSALRGSAVPVPRVYGLCEDSSIAGTPFFVMDYVAGRIFEDSRMPAVARAERSALFDAMNIVIAALHTIDPASVDLTDFGRPGNYIERQVARWTKQYRASMTQPIEEMERIIEWLPRHLPPERGGRIVHGDYKVDNIIFHPTEARVVALLDWELATIGDPLADFAFHLMAWHLEPTLFRGWACVGRNPERALCRAYVRITVASTALRFSISTAAILQGITRRIRGNAADGHASEVGRQARPVAQKAWGVANASKDSP